MPWPLLSHSYGASIRAIMSLMINLSNPSKGAPPYCFQSRMVRSKLSRDNRTTKTPKSTVLGRINWHSSPKRFPSFPPDFQWNIAKKPSHTITSTVPLGIFSPSTLPTKFTSSRSDNHRCVCTTSGAPCVLHFHLITGQRMRFNIFRDHLRRLPP